MLNRFNIGITSYENLQSLKAHRSDINALLELPASKLQEVTALLGKSKSQIKQDLFVLAELDFKRHGFFVEFGATNGIDLSNSYLLESEFEWKGILAEPAKCWHDALIKNRTCSIETNCVWRDSNSILDFNEAASAELSTISTYGASDSHCLSREVGTNYQVGTISLLDLLDKYNAPRQIDYLSIDTEGSEFEILSSFAPRRST